MTWKRKEVEGGRGRDGGFSLKNGEKEVESELKGKERYEVFTREKRFGMTRLRTGRNG